MLKGTRYILLSNHESLKDWQQERLSELLALNKRLFTVYFLKDDPKRLWQYRSPYHAERFLRGWCRRAIYSKIEPLKKFARMLKKGFPASWPIAAIPSTPAFSRGSTTRSRS